MLRRRISCLLSTAIAVFLAGCGSEPQQAQVSYKATIKPIVDKHCTECHLEGGKGSSKSGFRTDSYETLMKGTFYGPVVVPGNALSSSFYRLVAGKVDPSIRMPHGKEPLSESEISSIEIWITQGAKNN